MILLLSWVCWFDCLGVFVFLFLLFVVVLLGCCGFVGWLVRVCFGVCCFVFICWFVFVGVGLGWLFDGWFVRLVCVILFLSLCGCVITLLMVCLVVVYCLLFALCLCSVCFCFLCLVFVWLFCI